MMAREKVIAIFDSGVGGLTVLSQLQKVLPSQDFVYYADLDNVPYGPKSKTMVTDLTVDAIDLIQKEFDLQAIVLACNTATSAAASYLRSIFRFPVIGMEPAIKPALERAGDKKVLVLATAFTLREEKLQKLVSSLDAQDRVEMIAAPGLVEYAEKGIFAGTQLEMYLKELIGDVYLGKIGCVVLGCTHFIYYKDLIANIYGSPVLDGNDGTVRHLVSSLTTTEAHNGRTFFRVSGREVQSSYFNSWLNLSS